MELQKNWYLSRTLWTQAVAIVGMGLSLTGIVKLDEAMQGSIVDTLITLGTLVSQVLAIYYRFKADKKIA